ncbi:hypothetical protein BAE44_0000245 [Dichanthelium oligosanthes]|uniref:DUF7595 domain-containing protein n=1 Tax=Dichanthelium oligosanthes TaxID=888268 RepID=A0A1E5WMV3_9POAL|nr:hypothetical protein BAE44_0000245 [Dichanthelium oligosanthes]
MRTGHRDPLRRDLQALVPLHHRPRLPAAPSRAYRRPLRHVPVGCFFRCWSESRRVGFTETRTSSSSSRNATASPVAKTIGSFMSRNAEHLESFEPVVSRGGLVLFRRDADSERGWSRAREQRRLCLRNPVTGWCRSIPAPTVNDQAHVLLAGEDGRSFHLVAVNLEPLRRYGDLSFQAFTSAEAEDTHGSKATHDGGAWGPVIELSPPEDFEKVVNPTPVVLGRVAHWLFRSYGAYNVLALDVHTARTACIDLPPESALDSDEIPRNQMLLSSTTDGRLSLLAGEETRISVWALTTPAATTTTTEEGPAGGGSNCGWSLHAAYEREWIAGFVQPRGGARRKPGCPVIELLRSGGEGGGAVFMRVHGFGSCYVLLNMETNEIVPTEVPVSCICPYEVDLALLTAPMKPF